MQQRISWTSSRLGRLGLTLGLLLGAAQFAISIPARATVWLYGADHDEVYQVQRGDLVCHSREACGGPAAIPMNRPGWFYLPRGLYAAQPPLAPGPAPVHRRHKHRY